MKARSLPFSKVLCFAPVIGYLNVYRRLLGVHFGTVFVPLFHSFTYRAFGLREYEQYPEYQRKDRDCGSIVVLATMAPTKAWMTANRSLRGSVLHCPCPRKNQTSASENQTKAKKSPGCTYLRIARRQSSGPGFVR